MEPYASAETLAVLPDLATLVQVLIVALLVALLRWTRGPGPTA